ncbi:GxxExxY protein [candidate division TA06 bacterium]|nr:GxxExxY protein [candidate division TA06 bacterium]
MTIESKYIYSEITDSIIRCSYEVHRKFGFGFLEKVYENALSIKLKQAGHTIEQQVPIKVYFEEHVVGDYFADIIVDGKVVIELKSCSELSKAHETQLVNYLKATKIKVDLLIYFGNRVKICRKIF